jgi:UDP-glucose 4-epimerase
MSGKQAAVLVVGGAGYIGCHAARELRRKGYEAIIYDNLSTGHSYLAEGFELIVGDIADSAKLTTALRRVDAVMHFAANAYVAESVANPRKYFQNNVVDALTLLNAVVDAGVRKFIFSSTCATYGIPEILPITEKVPRACQSVWCYQAGLRKCPRSLQPSLWIALCLIPLLQRCGGR